LPKCTISVDLAHVLCYKTSMTDDQRLLDLHVILTRQLLHHAGVAGIKISEKQAKNIAAQQVYGVMEWMRADDHR
jgi:hypothetical protein